MWMSKHTNNTIHKWLYIIQKQKSGNCHSFKKCNMKIKTSKQIRQTDWIDKNGDGQGRV